MRHAVPISTQRYLAVGTTALAGLLVLGFALPDNSPPPRLLNDPGDRAEPPLGDPRAALALWKTFPVGAEKRPMLVFDAMGVPVGLRTNPTLSRLVNGRWELPDELPESAPRVDSYPVVSASEAVAALRHSLQKTYPAVAASDAEAEPIRITELRLNRRTFDTDRGRLTLPAWSIVFDREVGIPATVLAIRGDELFPSPVPTDASGDVTVSPNGLRLTYNFLGAAAGQGNCRADYSPVSMESATAVAIGAIEHPNGHNRNGTCRLASYRRSVSVLLTAPLDNRVAITYSYGAPLPVRPDGTYRWYRPTVDKR